MNSIATGRTPALMMSLTQAPATSLLSNPISTGRAPSGLRRMRKDASVTTPSWPSEPQISPSRSYPAASRCAPPSSITVPSICTSVTPSRLLVVTPYFRQCAPPEFIAILPAMAQASCARRVGGVEKPLFLDRAGDAQIGAPGLHADHAVGVIGLQHLGHPRHAEDHAVGGGQRPPASDVPAPRGTTGTPIS